MNITAEFERQKDGSWIAKFPGVREVVGYGWTRHEAAVGLTANAVRVLAESIETGQVEVEEDPVRILIPADTTCYLAEILFGLVREASTFRMRKRLPPSRNWRAAGQELQQHRRPDGGTQC